MLAPTTIARPCPSSNSTLIADDFRALAAAPRGVPENKRLLDASQTLHGRAMRTLMESGLQKPRRYCS
jgi:hypothetical protein